VNRTAALASATICLAVAILAALAAAAGVFARGGSEAIDVVLAWLLLVVRWAPAAVAP
jgi:hypothetical protein